MVELGAMMDFQLAASCCSTCMQWYNKTLQAGDAAFLEVTSPATGFETSLDAVHCLDWWHGAGDVGEALSSQALRQLASINYCNRWCFHHRRANYSKH